ncbi:hypothetical protein TNCT_415821 [Trichonephila clavata]|uniref:Uncharacterized protein n=1 Tax=Trichonephila clavata TaxID=2740835 RepID=A0A8X6M082_TRICU|nr:hypothetical protein TNCT_415821 [Trichonephila clavata]
MRYVYAHSKLHWSVSEWHRVIFSDEKIFRSSSRGALRVYRPVQGATDLMNNTWCILSIPSMDVPDSPYVCGWPLEEWENTNPASD